MIKHRIRVTLIIEKLLSCIFCHSNVIGNCLKQGNALRALSVDVAVRTRYIMRVLRENQARLKANVAQLLLMTVTVRKHGSKWDYIAADGNSSIFTDSARMLLSQ